MNKITPADISDPMEVVERAKTFSTELGTDITPGFEALVFKASRGIEDIYELTYIRKDGSRFPAVVSVTALRDEGNRPSSATCSSAPTTRRASRPKRRCSGRARCRVPSSTAPTFPASPPTPRA
jgi:hypothetical protein